MPLSWLLTDKQYRSQMLQEVGGGVAVVQLQDRVAVHRRWVVQQAQHLVELLPRQHHLQRTLHILHYHCPSQMVKEYCSDQMGHARRLVVVEIAAAVAAVEVAAAVALGEVSAGAWELQQHLHGRECHLEDHSVGSVHQEEVAEVEVPERQDSYQGRHLEYRENSQLPGAVPWNMAAAVVMKREGRDMRSIVLGLGMQRWQVDMTAVLWD